MAEYVPEYDERFDLDKDGVIGDADVELFRSVYGQYHTASPLAAACDWAPLGTSLKVDIADWLEFADHYGAVKPPGITPPVFVPEQVIYKPDVFHPTTGEISTAEVAAMLEENARRLAEQESRESQVATAGAGIWLVLILLLLASGKRKGG